MASEFELSNLGFMSVCIVKVCKFVMRTAHNKNVIFFKEDNNID